MGPQTEAEFIRQARQTAEEEAARDLDKPLKQLLVDVHHEILHPLGGSRKSTEENVAHANKRIASIMVRVGDSNEKASKLLVALTVALFFFTLVLVCCGAMQIVLSIITIMQQAGLFPARP